MNKKIILSVVCTLSFVLNLAYIHKDGLLFVTSSSKSDTYSLLSKRIFTDYPNDIIINFTPLRKAVREYVEAQNGKVGIYVEYLPSGVSIGANDRQEVKLASLSKVPLVMSVLRKVQKGQLKLDDVLVLKKENMDPLFGNLWKSGEGAKFTVRELIEICLKESDNTAYNTLFEKLTPEEIMDVYSYLDIEVLSVDTNPIVSPKSFSSIFRSLYLASYLNEEYSNYILTILTQTIFNDKIPAGMPSTVLVAHKIGVFNRPDTDEKVYTDCGIVYLPKRPYIICVFVKDDDEAAKKYISYLSQMVYSYMTVVKEGD